MIPQIDLKDYYLRYKQDIDLALSRTLASGLYVLGKEVAAFEAEFASYLGVAHAIGTGNGTDAIQLALLGFGIGPGDAVATVSHTAVATVAAIKQTGATPLLVDIDSQTFTMSPTCLEQALMAFSHSSAANQGIRVKAVIPVHLYGHPADMSKICTIAEHYGLSVIEDCAQAAGAAIDGRKAGTFGHAAAFSFYPTKNLGALGDGGAVVTNDTDLAERLRMLREYGWKDRVSIIERGINSRLDEIQAAILRVRLAGLDDDNNRRRGIADYYSEKINNEDIPICRKGCSHVYHQYVIRSSFRDELRRFLLERGVATAIHYPQPVHMQPAFSGCLFKNDSLHTTESVCREILSLPMYLGLTLVDLEKICRAIETFEVS